jgi:MFS family permease
VSQPAAAAPWSPLASPLFRGLWIAALVSNIGTWVQDVGAAWLMTSLAPSPLMVALVQAATTLPIFLLALPAGALADVVDRRRLLLVTQGWMLAATGVLGALTFAGATGPWTLLALTFVVGLGAALNAPAWQAIIPELVARPELPAALALNGVGINAARALGPALGGLVVAAAGPGAAFLLNAASFAGVIAVLYRWRRPVRHSTLPAERMMGAILAGLRYVRHAPDLRSVLVRSGAFILSGSALWALLPVVARFDLGLGPGGYGLLLGCLGIGAVLGALLLPWWRRTVAANTLVAGATLTFAAVLLGAALAPGFLAMGAVMLAGGAAWLVLLTSFHSSAQAALPGWVRGRALAIYLMLFFGGMAAGSVLWGAVATHVGARAALMGASAGVVLGLALTARHRLAAGEGLNLAPSRHWPAPVVLSDADLDRGPVLVTVEYRVEAAKASEFARAMREVRRVRLRDGAFRWDLFQDQSDPQRFVETFLVDSWVEHLRQHERLTVADREVESRARAFHAGPQPPIVTHFIAHPMPE